MAYANIYGDDGSAIDRLRGGQGSGRLLPTLQSAGSAIKSILADVERLDQLLSSVASKASTAASALSAVGGASGGGDGGSTGGGSHDNGMPKPNVPKPQNDSNNSALWRSLALTAAGTFMGSSNAAVTQTYSADTTYSRLRMLTTGSFSTQMAMPQTLHNAFAGSFYNTADRNQAMNTAMDIGINPLSAFGTGVAAMSRGNAFSLNQNMGAAASAISNPMAVVRLQAMGVNMLDRNGNPGDPRTIARQLQQLSGANYARGDLRRVAADFSPYGPMRQELEAMGISDQDISQIYQPMFQASAQSGSAIGTSDWTAAYNKVGGQTLVGGYKGGRAVAKDQMNANAFSGQRAGISQMNSIATNVDNIANMLGSIEKMLGYATGMAGGIATGPGGGSVLGGLGKDLLNDLVLKQLLSKGGGGSILGRLGGVGAEAGLLRPFGGLGGIGSRLLKGGGYALGGDVAGSIAGHYVHGRTGSRLSGALKGAGIGAGIGAMIPIADATGIPEGVGAVIGGALGALHSSGGGFFGDAAGSGNSSSVPAGLSANSLVGYAETWIGTPYSWGGGGVNGPSNGTNQGSGTVGFDCSSFVQNVFAHFGVMLPRTTYDQVNVGAAVAPKDARPGDLLFFGSPTAPHHVAIYIGNGKMIEAPYTGSSVRVTGVDLNSVAVIKRVMNVGGSVLDAQSGTGSGAGSPVATYASVLASGIKKASQRSMSLAGVNASNPSAGVGALGANGLSTGSVATGSAGSTVPQAPSTVSGNVALGKRMAAQMGWGGDEWNALYALWNRESGWNANAVNPTSGAAGIPQALGHGHVFNLGDASAQISWGLNYISGRYGDPLAALRHENQVGWYAKGAWELSKDETARVHKGEMILPSEFAAAVRQALASHGGGGGGGSRSVTLNVYPAGADETAAERLATMVKEILDEEAHLTTVASG